ncbi:hypothetical protein NHF50_07800 [Flavobacterium sp. NRK F10]|uniref:hypothetical protein n=1 Tax=Flavobacterium sp. NRK F10 TaxID=2954931 RepID=UPI002091D814|nr:hypothetical protein [Flavobacterium sp. NRK F10]MCO6174949.1 hypothetical protein [Flavobacterium sp. NRK F10]
MRINSKPTFKKVKMKTLLNILCLLLISLNVNCQVLPLYTPSFERTNGAYLKDLNDVQSFLEGTWIGIINDKEYTFQFVKFPRHLISYGDVNYYEDILKVKFKVVDLVANQLIYSDLKVVDFDDYKINLSYYGNNIGYSFYYEDEMNCSNSAKFYIYRIDNNTDQIEYKNFIYDEYWDCSYTNQLDIPMFLPKVDLILTRQ